MLVIRQQQIEAMIAADDGETELLVLDAVRAANGERLNGVSPDDLIAMTKFAVARARIHGLSKPEDVAAFSAVMFATAPNFDEQPDIKLILNDPGFTPSERFYQIFERADDKAWAEAEQLYDRQVWFAASRDD